MSSRNHSASTEVKAPLQPCHYNCPGIPKIISETHTDSNTDPTTSEKLTQTYLHARGRGAPQEFQPLAAFALYNPTPPFKIPFLERCLPALPAPGCFLASLL